MASNERVPRVKAEDAINRLRKTLTNDYPDFGLADSVEREAEEFCGKIRRDLRDKRKLMHVDQATLAQKMNLSQSSISKIEHGKGDIGVKTLHRYSSALGLVPLLLFVSEPSCSTGDGGQAITQYDVEAANEIVAAQEMFLRRVSEMIPQLMPRKARAS